MVYLGKNSVGISNIVGYDTPSMAMIDLFIEDYSVNPPIITVGILDTVNRRIYVSYGGENQ